MRLKTFSIRQRGAREDINIFVSTVTAIQLIERCAIDRWTTENTSGYQRIPE